jgi:hypothetical protein
MTCTLPESLTSGRRSQANMDSRLPGKRKEAQLNTVEAINMKYENVQIMYKNFTNIIFNYVFNCKNKTVAASPQTNCTD